MQKIKLFQVRDFGDTIRDTIEFLRNHAQPLWKIVLTYLLPIYLVISIITVLVMKDFLIAMQEAGQSPEQLQELIQDMGKDILNNPVPLFGGIGAVSLFSLLVGAYMSSLVYNYVLLYKQTTIGEVSAQELHQKSVGDMAWYLGYTFLLMFIFILGIALPIGFAAASQSGALIGVVVCVILFVAIYAVGALALFFPIAFLERGSFGETVNRCRALISGNWWRTFGLVLVVAMGLGIVGSMVGGILGLVGSMFGMMGRLVFSQVGQAAIGVVTNMAIAVAMCLHYGTLRTEMEGSSDEEGKDLIDQIGDNEQ